MKNIVIKTLLFFIVCVYSNAIAQKDSVHKKENILFKNLKLKTALSTSFIAHKNWQQGGNDNISFLGNLDVRHATRAKKLTHSYALKAELGYSKFLDSLWIKNTDRWRIALQWNYKPGNSLIFTYSFTANSQFTDSYKYKVDRKTQELSRKRLGGFISPANAINSLGFNWSFWDGSRINFAVASLKTDIRPLRITDTLGTDYFLKKNKTTSIFNTFGSSLQTDVYKKLGKNVLWENTSDFFLSGGKKLNYAIDFDNRFSFVFFRFMQFRLDTHLIYDKLYFHGWQFRQELLLGLFLDKNSGTKKVNTFF